MPTVKATADTTLRKAASYIGVRGCPNEFTRWYSPRHGLPVDYVYAWCAAFVSYVLCHVGIDGFYDSASASGVATQFPRVYSPKKGDIVTFNWTGSSDQSWCDHVGIVESVNGNQFITIEGNTGNTYGGEVMRVLRAMNQGYYCAFYRPTYKEPPLKKPTVSVRDYHGTWRGPTKYGTAGLYNTNIAYVTSNATGGRGYRVKDWTGLQLGWITANNKNDLDYGCAGNGRAIRGIQFDDPRIDFRFHLKGVKWRSGKNKGKYKWSQWRHGGSKNSAPFASRNIDKIQIRLHKD